MSENIVSILGKKPATVQFDSKDEALKMMARLCLTKETPSELSVGGQILRCDGVIRLRQSVKTAWENVSQDEPFALIVPSRCRKVRCYHEGDDVHCEFELNVFGECEKVNLGMTEDGRSFEVTDIDV